MKQSELSSALAACFFGGLTTISQASLVAGDVINIDLQPPDGAGGGGNVIHAAGDDGPYSQAGTPVWNVFSSWAGGSDLPLVDDGGEDDGVTLTVTANGGWFSPNYTSDSPNSALFDYFQENVADEMPFSIANLPAGDYELYVMAGTSQWTEGQTTVVSVTGQEDQLVTWTGVSGLPSGTGWASGVNYVKFDISLSSPGEIAGIINSSTDTSFLSGLQLRMVSSAALPEPTRITATPTIEGGMEVAISFSSTPGASYSIEASTDLVRWLELDDGFPASPDGETTIFTTTEGAPAPEMKFYRVFPSSP